MKKLNWLLSAVFGVLAAIVYFASMADYAYPGLGAHLMAIWHGLGAGAAADYPLMTVFARLLGSGNVIAPVCGVISVVTFFHLVAAFVEWRIGDERPPKERSVIALIAASVATFVFMLTPAVRSAATHVEPRMFAFAWALLSFSLVFPALKFPKVGVWILPLLLGVLLALGLCDSVVFVFLLPFYFIVVGAVARRKGARPYEPVFLLLVVGFAALLGAMVFFDLTLEALSGHILGEFHANVANTGCTFVVLFTVLPFVAALISSGRAFRDTPTFALWFFHGALTFVAILSSATPLSPSKLMEPFGINPVLASAFAAAVSGYLVAYWWINRAQVMSLVIGSILAFVLAVTSLWHCFSFDSQSGAFADKVAFKILKDLGRRTWFVSDGTIDDHVKLMAEKEGKTVHVVSLARDLDKRYLEWLSDLIREEGVGGARNGALRLSLDLGVLPFVQDWFSCDPTVQKTVAVFGAPDLWYSADVRPVPEFLFFGGDAAIVPDWSAWDEFSKILTAPKDWGSYRSRKVTNPTDRLRLSLRRHLGFVANNRGVWYQDQKDDDAAFRMYELVLNQIDPDNICTIFNEVAMVGQKHPRAILKKKELERILKKAVEDKSRRYLLWRLSTYYGYIRNPESFVRLGHAWARSGRAGDALYHVRRAVDFLPADRRAGLLNMMAALYASENEQGKSRRIYDAVLAKNAKDHDALIGMMRLELLDGNAQKALEYMQRASESAGKGRRSDVEQAMVAMMKNDLATAKRILKKVTDADRKDLQAWSLMAAVTMQEIDATTDEKRKAVLLKEIEGEILPELEKGASSQFDYYLQATKGFVLLRKGADARAKARDAFVTAAKSRPDIAATQDLVLGLDISMDDKENAEAHAREVLRRNRNAPLANYVMGSLALGKEKMEEAELYLRKAADAPQPVALALNDLAEVLRRNKKFAEAERYARKATEKAPNLYVAWETLGAVLMDAKLGLDEAEACIRRACQLSKDKDGKEADVRMLISLARVQMKRGDLSHAKMTIRKVRSRIDELSDFEKREFEDFAGGAR